MKLFTSWRSWKHRHWGMHLVIAAMLLTVVLDWVPVPGWIEDPVWAFGFTALLVGIVLTASHRRGDLCEDCIEAMPLDGQEAAARRRPVLWFFHWPYGNRRTSLVITGVVLGLIALSSFLDRHSVPAKILNDTAMLILVAGDVAFLVHQRLQPWCPWCHWDDGGDEDAEVPDPVAPETV